MRRDAHHIPVFRDLAVRSIELANSFCTTTFSGDASCQWYHSAWPVLRLINAVSTPYWHLDFYDFAFRTLCRELHDTAPKILVAGAADFSMAAVIHETAPSTNIELTVLDQCGTALTYSEYWAQTHRVPLTTQRKCVLSIDSTDSERFDIAASDALLTRFPRSDRDTVLSAIRSRLRPGGVFVTTVRDHSRIASPLNGDEHLIDQQGLTPRGQNELAKHGFDASTLDAFTDMARQYCHRMHSFTFSGLDEVSNLAKHSGFHMEHVESCATPGEFHETTYLRLMLRRN